MHADPPLVPIANAPTANAPVSTTSSALLGLPVSALLGGDDTVGSLLQQISSGPVAQLIAGIQTSHPTPDPAAATSLLQTAAAAVVQGNAPAALAALTELVQRSPEHVETLSGESSLSPIRAQVQDLLTRVTATAKVEAEVRLQAATQAVESAKPHSEHPGDWNPREILPVAEQLIDSGRHSNILLATDLSQAVINYYGGFEIATPRPVYRGERTGSAQQVVRSATAPWAGAAGGLTELLGTMWRTSPILVLFFFWVALGLMALIAAGIDLWSVDLSLEVWGAGSAGLLGFGTYRRLRVQKQ